MNVLKAILLKLISAFLFAVMSALVRWLGAKYPLGQLVFFRSAFAILPVVLIYAWRNELMAAVRTTRPLGHVGRGAISMCGMFCNFGALARLPIVDATAIGFASPLITVAFAAIFPLFENLIQAVNVLGSLFYGTILGVFLVAFFLKHVQGRAVFIAASISQALILGHFVLDQNDVFARDVNGMLKDPLEIAFLWYNLIAPGIVVIIALVLERWIGEHRHPNARNDRVVTSNG